MDANTSQDHRPDRPAPKTPRTLRQHLKLAAFRLTAVGIAFVVLALAGEVVLRLCTDHGFSLLVKDSVMGQRYRCDFAQSRHVPESGRTISLRFNRDGYRGPNRTHQKPPGVRRIAVLGDSTIAAIAVEESQTLAAVLENRLNADAAETWQVMNFGVSGYSTGQSLLTWRNYARAYEPRLVILAFTISNDLSDNCSDTSSSHRPYFSLDDSGQLVLEPMSATRTGASRWLNQHSRLYVWQKHMFARIRHGAQNATNRVPPGLHIMNTEPSATLKRAWAITEALIKQLRDEVRQAGAELLVVTVPVAHQYDDDMWQNFVAAIGPEQAEPLDRQHPDRQLAEICTRHNVPLLTLTPAFRQARSQGHLNLVLGHGHWNIKGNQLAADAVYEYLVKNRELIDQNK